MLHIVHDVNMSICNKLINKQISMMFCATESSIMVVCYSKNNQKYLNLDSETLPTATAKSQTWDERRGPHASSKA